MPKAANTTAIPLRAVPRMGAATSPDHDLDSLCRQLELVLDEMNAIYESVEDGPERGPRPGAVGARSRRADGHATIIFSDLEFYLSDDNLKKADKIGMADLDYLPHASDDRLALANRHG